MKGVVVASAITQEYEDGVWETGKTVYKSLWVFRKGEKVRQWSKGRGQFLQSKGHNRCIF